MKKIVFGLVILLLMGVSTAYTSSSLESGTRLMTSKTDNAIFAIDDNLEIKIYLDQTITKKYIVKDGVKKLSGASRRVKFNHLEHNLSLTNNSSEIINTIIVDNPFDMIHIGKISYVKSGKNKRFPVELVDDSKSSSLIKLIDKSYNDDIEIRIEGDNRLATLEESVSVDVITDTIIKESVKVIVTKAVIPEDGENESAKTSAD